MHTTRRSIHSAAFAALIMLACTAAAYEPIDGLYLDCRVKGLHVGYLRLDLAAETDAAHPRQAWRFEQRDVRNLGMLGLSVAEDHRWTARLAGDLSLVSFESHLTVRGPDGATEELVYLGEFDAAGRGFLSTDAPSRMAVDAGGPLFLFDTLPLFQQATTVRALVPYTAAIITATVVMPATGWLDIMTDGLNPRVCVRRSASGVPERIGLDSTPFRYQWRLSNATDATLPPGSLSLLRRNALLASLPLPGILTEGEIKDPSGARRLRVALAFPRAFRVPADGSRQVHLAGERRMWVVETHARRFAPVVGDASAWLAPDLFANSEHPAVVALARELSEGTMSELERATRLMHAVYGRLRFDLAPTLPVASEVLESRAGDATEYTTLYAALARAAGLPCRVVAGFVCRDGLFVYHAWNEVAVHWPGQGRVWVPLDPTCDMAEVDATHLKLVEGNVDRQIALTPLLERTRITVMEVE